MAFKLSKKSLENLKGVRPDLVVYVKLLIKRSPVDFGITEPQVRSLEEQKKKVAQGFSKTLKSKHLPQKDGYGWALDLVPWVAGKFDWSMEHCKLIAEEGKKLAAELDMKMQFGADWKGFKDGPHHELEE